MNKLFAFYFLYLSLMAFCQNSKVEKLENWVFPQKNNFVRMKSDDENNPSYRINYFKLSEKLIGTSLEIEFMNSDPSLKLFEIGNGEISLIKVKDGAFGDLGGDEYSFDRDNVYWKLPPENGKIEWNYKEGEGIRYHCVSYWKNSKEKTLVVERNDGHFSTIEYYSENKGLIKEDDNNLLESGFDSEITNDSFNMNFERIKSAESTISSNRTDETKTNETNQIKKNPTALKDNVSEKEKLNADYLERYGRTYDEYQKMFKHLPEQSIKKVKMYSVKLRKYTTLNIIWFPRQEAINNQKFIDSKHRSTIFK